MSIAFDGTAEYVRRTAGMPSATQYTIMCWARFPALPGSYGVLFAMGGASAHAVSYNSGGKLVSFDGAADAIGPTTLAINTWYHIAFACASGAGNLKTYLNGALEITDTQVGVTVDEIAVFGSFYSEYLGGHASAIKIYNATLTQEQVQLEMHHRRPADPTSLNSWYPTWFGTAEHGKDYSGNSGRDWIEIATPQDSDDPPVSW